MFLHSFVAPDFSISANERPEEWPLLGFQHAGLGVLDFWKVTALLSWVSLLGIAAWALARLPQHPRFRLMLTLSIAGQVVLHLAYGAETFLYALDWLPLFVSAAALATLSRWRPLVLVAATVFVVAGAIHNGGELKAALDLVVADAAASGG